MQQSVSLKRCVFEFSGANAVCKACGRVVVNAPAGRLFAECKWKPLGPGAELSKLLKRLGIEPTPTCQCRAMAAQMDDWGPDECERPERIEQVLSVMRAEANARGLPFLDAAGRMLVRRAIRNARRAAAS